MTQDEMKQAAAQAAVQFLKEGDIIGVGTGSTVNYFIDAMGSWGGAAGAVASSEATAARLTGLGIPVLDLVDVDHIEVYVDGADEINDAFDMIKGGGGALTREKIVAAVATRFVCIADETKLVAQLGAFPLPVEVIPMARTYVARRLENLGGVVAERRNFVTDNGNAILDVQNLDLSDPVSLEQDLNNIVGVVTNGLFAARGADAVVLGTSTGVNVKSRK